MMHVRKSDMLAWHGIVSGNEIGGFTINILLLSKHQGSRLSFECNIKLIFDVLFAQLLQRTLFISSYLYSKVTHLQPDPVI